METYMHLKHTKDIDKYLSIKDGKLIFNGDELIIRIPERFKEKGLIEVGDGELNTVGLAHLIINKKEQTTLCLLGRILIAFETFNIVEIEHLNYIEIVRHKGDVFMNRLDILQNNTLPYIVYTEMDNLGNVPYFITYENYERRWEHAKELTGLSLDQDKAIYEMACAHLARDSENMLIQYRHTDKKKQPKFIGAREIALSTESTLAKLAGSYFKDALDGAIASDDKGYYETENMLRS